MKKEAGSGFNIVFRPPSALAPSTTAPTMLGAPPGIQCLDDTAVDLQN